MQTIIQEKFLLIESSHLYALQKKDFEKGRIYCIVAESQTQGVGRRGSRWHSPKGNLYCSIILDASQGNSQVNQILAYSILKVLQRLNIQLQFKWPNDLLYSGRKICGILSQRKNQSFVLSFGLNVNTPLENRACMSEIRKKTFDLDTLKIQILDELLSNLDSCDSNSYMDELSANLAYKNQMIRFELNQKVCRARLIDLHEDGGLAVQIKGQVHTLTCANNIRCDSKSSDRPGQ